MKVYVRFGGVWCRGVASGTCWLVVARRNGGEGRSADAVAQGCLGLYEGVAWDTGSVSVGSVDNVGLLWLLWRVSGQ